MSFTTKLYTELSTKIVESLINLVGDNIDQPEVIDELAEVLETEVKGIVCENCSWFIHGRVK